MKREQKYPETSTFHYYNANPKDKITADCVIRALCTAMQEPYYVVYKELFEFSMKCGYMLNEKQCYDKYLQSKGWVKHKQPRKEDNTKYTGKEFCEELDCNTKAVGVNVIARIGGHHIVCIKEDSLHGLHKVYDIWDSTDGCIGNYWTKD